MAIERADTPVQAADAGEATLILEGELKAIRQALGDLREQLHHQAAIITSLQGKVFKLGRRG